MNFLDLPVGGRKIPELQSPQFPPERSIVGCFVLFEFDHPDYSAWDSEFF
jgi:hypothetical protein